MKPREIKTFSECYCGRRNEVLIEDHGYSQLEAKLNRLYETCRLLELRADDYSENELHAKVLELEKQNDELEAKLKYAEHTLELIRNNCDRFTFYQGGSLMDSHDLMETALKKIRGAE